MTLKATFVGLLINTGLAGIKMAAGILGHSHALMADATESIADLFSSVIVWRRSKRRATNAFTSFDTTSTAGWARRC